MSLQTLAVKSSCSSTLTIFLAVTAALLLYIFSSESPLLSFIPISPLSDGATLKRTSPPHCVQIIPSDTSLSSWIPFNSRSFCVHTAPVCVSPRTFTDVPTISFQDPQQIAKSTCNFTSPSVNTLLRFRKNFTCDLLYSSVIEAHGKYNITDPALPERAYINSINDIPGNRTITDLPGLTIFIPAYPFLNNIFHFTQTIFPAIQAVVNIPTVLNSMGDTQKHSQLNLVFRGAHPFQLGHWHGNLSKILIKQRLKPMGFKKISIHTFDEEDLFFYEMKAREEKDVRTRINDTICSSGTGVLLGKHTSILMWPFSNHDSSLNWPFIGHEDITRVNSIDYVPYEALALRSALYSEYNMSTKLPSNLDIFQDIGGNKTQLQPRKRLILDLPPLHLTYSSRNTDPKPAKPYILPLTGNTRRLSESDHKWLVETLRKEASKKNFTFRKSEITSKTDFRAQVETFQSSGVVFGLHGANLMNSIFSPPFSAVAEIAPLTYHCYIAGSNSGLNFWSLRPQHESTVEEMGGCQFVTDREQCEQWIHRNFRTIKIGEDMDHSQIIEVVAEAMDHVLNLRARFEHIGGIPVHYDAYNGIYRIDGGGLGNGT